MNKEDCLCRCRSCGLTAAYELITTGKIPYNCTGKLMIKSVWNLVKNKSSSRELIDMEASVSFPKSEEVLKFGG